VRRVAWAKGLPSRCLACWQLAVSWSPDVEIIPATGQGRLLARVSPSSCRICWEGTRALSTAKAGRGLGVLVGAAGVGVRVNFSFGSTFNPWASRRGRSRRRRWERGLGQPGVRELPADGPVSPCITVGGAHRRSSSRRKTQSIYSRVHRGNRPARQRMRTNMFIIVPRKGVLEGSEPTAG
jgi:hypothetical protein